MIPPKLSPSEASELQRDSYIMHIHRTMCARCDCGERYSDLFEVWIHPTKTRLTGFRQLRKAYLPIDPKLHIDYIELPEQQIPVCSDCVHTYTAQDSAKSNVVTPAAWADTLKRKYAPPAKAEVKIATSAGAKTTKIIPTLDEL